MSTESCPVQGAGLGLRRGFAGSLLAMDKPDVDFLEVAPENWLDIGGKYGRQFNAITERFPMLCHGLSLSIGSPAPLDEHFLQRLKGFFDKHHIQSYSEHLSYCSDDGHLYDLMPIPFTEEAVHYVADRIKRVQQILERRLIIENVSYYAAPGQEMDEVTFTKAILEEADCDLLLDVNNVYVNSVNHGYDAKTFIDAMPSERIAYLHIAGHYNEAEDLIVDTHGADVIDPVWDLLDSTYQTHGQLPTLLERDFNLPPLPELLGEVDLIRGHQQQFELKHASHG
jgi:hypothetical protein